MSHCSVSSTWDCAWTSTVYLKVASKYGILSFSSWIPLMYSFTQLKCQPLSRVRMQQNA